MKIIVDIVVLAERLGFPTNSEIFKNSLKRQAG